MSADFENCWNLKMQFVNHLVENCMNSMVGKMKKATQRHEVLGEGSNVKSGTGNE